jgi:ankyrin repeat protein
MKKIKTNTVFQTCDIKFAHEAAEYGKLDILKKELKDEGILTYKDPYRKDTPLHVAAYFRNLNQVKPYLNHTTINTRDVNNWTVLHCAAYGGCLSQIPAHLLTEKNLLEKNNHEETVTELAIRNKHTYQIPKNIFTEKFLLKKHRTGNNIFHFCCENEELEMLPIELCTNTNFNIQNYIGIRPLEQLGIDFDYITKKLPLLTWDFIENNIDKGCLNEDTIKLLKDNLQKSKKQWAIEKIKKLTIKKIKINETR